MSSRRLRPPGLESLFVGALVLFGFRLGARSITDNSMFVHLRTGVDMVAGGGIPSEDPYSYTAAGEPWVVQSWLASWTYGWAERLGGLGLVVLQQAVLMGLLAWLVVRLARTGHALRTAAAGAIAVGIGSPFWSPRPLLFGLLALALTITVVERRWSPWWLVPIVWVWVNTHGSFPLGLLWLGARAVGEAADRRRLPREHLRYGVGFVAGLAASVLSPLGARLLVFPLTVGEKREAFETIVEWRSPDFHRPAGLIALSLIACGLVVLSRARLPWVDVLPAAGFFALGLLALRNLPVAAIVLAPALGRALAPVESPEGPQSPGGGGRARDGSERLNAVFAVVLAAAFALFAAQALRGDALRTTAYPEEAVAAMEDMGLLDEPHRIAHQDAVGCYLILLRGREARVFVDDRVDMYPLEVSDDYGTLLSGKREALEVLDRYDVDVVLWERERALATVLREADGWERVLRRGDWEVFARA